MPGRILIVDSVATNRIVLKVKMLAAQFIVDACADLRTAQAQVMKAPPDLMLINLSDLQGDAFTLCKTLRQRHETANIAIIAIGGADTPHARFAALDAGVDDVLPQPANDALLLARIRSLLRVRSASQELMLRDSTSRALGFEESAATFAAAANIAMLTQTAGPHAAIVSAIETSLRRPVHVLETASDLWKVATKSGPDLFVIDATAAEGTQGSLFGLVADLRARAETRLTSQLILVPQDRPEVAAMFLDLGADDVVPLGADPREVALRAKTLIKRKLQQDKLRATVRDGLHAAVTDPLTGLYNRRYVEPHLVRLAEQSQASGRALAIMMIDIDHFKTINDRYGHPAGDAVLIELATRLRENLRAIDLVARMGGEEFLVALPRTTVTEARLAADRLRRVIKNAAFCLDDGKTNVPVTVSVGVAVSDPKGPHCAATTKMCKLADEALYHAKSAGRNQVAMSKSAA